MMKKPFFAYIIVAALFSFFFVFANSASAAGVSANLTCSFPKNVTGTTESYSCISDKELDPAIGSCTQGGGMTLSGYPYDCTFPKTGGPCTRNKDVFGNLTGATCVVPLPPPTVVVGVAPSTVDIGKRTLVIFWKVFTSKENPTSCLIKNSTDGEHPVEYFNSGNSKWPYSTNYSMTLDKPGTYSYTVTCTNGSGSGSGSASITAKLPFVQVSTSTCTGTDCNVDYKLLEPLPGLTGGVKDLSFAAMLGLAFKILITLGALVAVGTLVYSGIAYMLSSSPLETMGEAKRRMQSALWGLLILLGAWLLLNTINPQLVIFDLQIPGSEAAGPNPSGVKAAAGEATEADIRACEKKRSLGYSMQHQESGPDKCVKEEKI